MGRGFDNLHKFFVNVPAHTSNSRFEINTDRNCRGTATYKRNESSFPDDETYFTPSCSVLLFYHEYELRLRVCATTATSRFRYFNNFNKKGKIIFDESTRILKSTAGLRVVELRAGDDEMVKDSFVFTGKVLRYHFRIPEECSYDVLVVEDNSGLIFKTCALEQ